MDPQRMPCPDRIVDDMGGAFMMGAIGGSVWHGIKGAWNSPSGSRIPGGMYAIKARAPVLGGQFAVWGALFSSFDCTFAYVRHKEDPWNAIAGGFCTGGVLALRAGYKTALRSAIMGGTILALIEGCGIMLTKYMVPPMEPGEMDQSLLPPSMPTSLAAPTTHNRISGDYSLESAPDNEEHSSFV